MRINLRKTKPMKRDLVYTTGDLPMSPFDTTHFLTPSPHQNRRRRARVEKVGLNAIRHDLAEFLVCKTSQTYLKFRRSIDLMELMRGVRPQSSHPDRVGREGC